MNPNPSPRIAAWLESAWLARYLERGLDATETAWFEAYLLDKPDLLATVEADEALRSALASDRAGFERGSDGAAAPRAATMRARPRWPRWAALAASLVVGVGIGQLALRPSPPAADLIANPERIVFDTLRGASTPPLVQHGNSQAAYLFVEVAVPPTATDIELRHGARSEPLAVSAEGFVSFLVDQRARSDATPLVVAYLLDGQPQSQTLDLSESRVH